MGTITFKTKTGQSIRGEQITIPGYEHLDVVYVKDGFLGEIYELATGMRLAQCHGFTEREAMADVIGGFLKKNLSDIKILQKILDNDHPHGRAELRPINHSPCYQVFKDEQKQLALAQPYYWQEAERSKIKRLLDIATAAGMDKSYIAIFEAMYNERHSKYNKNHTTTIEGVIASFERCLRRFHARKVKIRGEHLPADLWDEDFELKVISWESMILDINMMRKGDISQYIPADILERYYEVWKLSHIKNNLWGYKRFAAHPQGDIIRLGIDLKKGRDESDTIEEILITIDKTYQAILTETQPYVLPPGD